MRASVVNEPFKSHLLSKVIPKKKWNEITEYIRLLILSLLQTFTSLWICTFTIATITRTFVCPGQVGTDLLTSTVAWSTFVNVCNFHKWNLTSDHARRLSFYWPLLYKRLTIQPDELCVCCCKGPEYENQLKTYKLQGSSWRVIRFVSVFISIQKIM